MKNRYLYIAGGILAVISTACSEEPFADGGEGMVLLHTSVNTHMEVVTRSVSQEIEESCMVWISNEKGLVRRYNSKSELPTEPIPFVGGHYVAEAWAGDSVPSSFDEIWYKGITDFEVKPSETARVSIVCSIANVGASVKYSPEIDNVLSDYTMTIGHSGKDGKLVYAGRDDEGRRGYFMMPSFDKNLSYELKGKQIDGSDFIFDGVIENVKPATEYVLNVLCKPSSNDVGGAIFTITIDETEIPVNSSVQIVAAPSIQGYDFNIADPIVAEQGKVGERSVYISSATELKSVILESELFKSFEGFDNSGDVNLLEMSDKIKSILSNEGIEFVNNYDAEKDQTLLKISFDSAFTNNLENGEYEISIIATDKGSRTTSAVLRINVTDAPIVTKDIDPAAISYKSATLYGQVAKDNVENVGFNYRKVGDSQWKSVAGQLKTRSFMKDDEFTALVEGLEPGTEYEYVATSDDYVSLISVKFKTLAYPQLPNAGFEDWYLYNNKVWIPGSDYKNNFWDTGNHGATLIGSANDNITTRSTEYVHSGKYSACLKSKNVIIKLAAGNLFSGNYLKTSGANAELGFGRPFIFPEKPKSVKVWVKYTPGTKRRGNGNYIKEGMADQGQIYIALTDNTTKTYTEKGDYQGTTWPFIIKTPNELFDKNADNVVAYGERNFEGATSGEGLIQIEIPLDYRKDIIPSHILFVASSSRYGDYFEGCDDSVMYLDDIELVY